MKKSILLISPTYRWWWVAPPCGIGWIANSFKKIDVRTKFIDCQITPRYKKKILQSLNEYDLVGITVNVSTISNALEISSFIRKNSPKTKIIMGGPHPTAMYEKLVPNYADIVVLGEGEDTITELMQKEQLSTIKGITYFQNGKLEVNPSRPLIEDLDNLGMPAWELYNLKKYRFASVPVPFAMITTSRGCPYNCIYCTKFIHGTKIRLRSPENVLEEIDYLVNNFAVEEIQIVDDNFTLLIEHSKNICKEIINHNYEKVRFSLPYGIKADIIIDDELVGLLAKAKFHQVAISIESGSQEVLKKIGRNQLNTEVLRANIKSIRKAGIEVNLYFMIGLPFDTIETMQKTIDLAKSLLPVDNVCFYMAIPFPGTAFYDMVKEKGRFLCNLTTNSFTYTGKATYEIGSLKAKDMNKMYRKAYRLFLFRAPLIKRILKINIKSLRIFYGLIKYGFNLLFCGGQIKNKSYLNENV